MAANPSGPPALPLIKVVGISASGKSTLVRGLREAGYDARPVSQEHSQVPDLWRQFDPPRFLICLEVDLVHQRIRRPDVEWNGRWLWTEFLRLADARDHADLRIDTSGIEPDEVLRIARVFLEHEKVRRAAEPLPPITATGAARRSE